MDNIGQFYPVRSPGDFKSVRVATAGSVTYIGLAGAGAASSDAGWQIKRLTDAGGGTVTVEWADGDTEFDNVWDDRASLSYS